MYGLINQARKDMFCARTERRVWYEVRHSIGISHADLGERSSSPYTILYKLID